MRILINIHIDIRLTTIIFSTSSLRSSTANNLSVPLRPFDIGITTNIVRFPGPPIKGGQLIYTLLCEAYEYWKLSNELITRTERHRHEPFTNILYIVEPLPRFEEFNTPSNIGTAFLQTVVKKTTWDNWPGPFEIGVYRLSGQPDRFASISVSINTPIPAVGLVSSWKNDTILTLPSNETNGVVIEAGLPTANRPFALSAVAITRRDWLGCFSAMLIFAFVRDYHEPVTRMISHSKVFGGPFNKAKATLTILSKPHNPLTWLQLATGLLKILAEWATVDIWQSTEDAKIWVHGELVATLTILPMPAAGGLTDGESVARA